MDFDHIFRIVFNIFLVPNYIIYRGHFAEHLQMVAVFVFVAICRVRHLFLVRIVFISRSYEHYFSTEYFYVFNWNFQLYDFHLLFICEYWIGLSCDIVFDDLYAIHCYNSTWNNAKYHVEILCGKIFQFYHVIIIIITSPGHGLMIID